MPLHKSGHAGSTPGGSTLHYVYPGGQGYRRIKRGKRFVYLGLRGHTLKSSRLLERIEALKIPPAWQEVWICPDPRGHLQARGVDARGRFQYRYHPDWERLRNERKFDALYAFGKKLPLLRKQIQKDLLRGQPDKLMLCALALSIMDVTYLRSGNRVYEKAHGSYGLTTLKNRHIHLNSSYALFKFKGKKGVRQEVRLNRKDLLRILRKVIALPGQQLFQYMDEEKNVQQLHSGDLNAYLQDILGADFSCKDFRTWAGSVIAIEFIRNHQGSVGAERPGIAALIEHVSKKLGNTPAVCKKYYIHPALTEKYENGEMIPCDTAISNPDRKVLEKMLLKFIKSQNIPSVKGKG